MKSEQINDNQMTVAAGLSNGVIGKMRSGVTKSINSTNIEKILNAYPRLSAEWLLTGEGEMLKRRQEDDRGENATVSMLIERMMRQSEAIGSLKEQLRRLCGKASESA